MQSPRTAWLSAALLTTALACSGSIAPADAQEAQKPNILVIWGDDIGQFNVSA